MFLVEIVIRSQNLDIDDTLESEYDLSGIELEGYFLLLENHAISIENINRNLYYVIDNLDSFIIINESICLREYQGQENLQLTKEQFNEVFELIKDRLNGTLPNQDRQEIYQEES